MNSQQGLGLSSKVSAQPFVPGGAFSTPAAASTVAAKPFVPASSSAANLTGAANAAVFVPGGLPRAPGGQQPQQQHASSSGGGGGTSNGTPVQSTRPSAHDFGLPEDDHALGLSSGTPAGGTKDMGAQAAEMFRAMKPFTPPPPMPMPPHRGSLNHGGGPGGEGPHASGGPPPGMGRGRGQPQFHHHHQQQQQQQQRMGGWGPPPPANNHIHNQGQGGRGAASSGRSMGERGRGRGRRSGPGSNRPSIAAYALGSGRMQAAGRFIPESLRQEMQQRAYLTASQLDPDALHAAGLPPMIQRYHSLYPLEDLAAAAERPSAALGMRSSVVKGLHSSDGGAYVLRRLDGRQVVPTAELLAAGEAAVEGWAPVANHPNLVGLREVLVTDEVDAMSALCLVHDYHPGALTLEQAHILPTQMAQGLVRSPASEDQMWSYLVQITSALRAVHCAGLAVRAPALAPSKVLLVQPGRLRLGAAGVADILSEGPPGDLAAAQRQDLAAVGSLLLTLACAARSTAPSLDVLAAHHSREFCHIIAGLLAAGDGGGFPSWRGLAAALGDRVFTELDAAGSQVDSLSVELQKECENGRLARLLVKLALVNERPQLHGDQQWAETGDRYLLKLFRDFVFHQVDESGAPLVDWGHVLEALNKADAGVAEQVLLLSRDEASMLVVSYEDVRRCLHSAYAELKAAAAGAGGKAAQGGGAGGRAGNA